MTLESWGLVPTIAKQATNQAVRFPVQFYAKQFLTGGDKSLDANPLYNGLFAEVRNFLWIFAERKLSASLLHFGVQRHQQS